MQTSTFQGSSVSADPKAVQHRDGAGSNALPTRHDFPSAVSSHEVGKRKSFGASDATTKVWENNFWRAELIGVVSPILSAREFDIFSELDFFQNKASVLKMPYLTFLKYLAWNGMNCTQNCQSLSSDYWET